MPTDYLEGMPEKSLSCHLITNVIAWSLRNTTAKHFCLEPCSIVRLNKNWEHSRWVWHKKKDDYTEKNLIPTVKCSVGSVMLWGPGNLVRVLGIMYSMKYQDILNQNLAASAKKLKLGRCWVFQQDKDKKHMSRSTQKWFTEHKIKLLLGPSTPGLNPIENLWDELKSRVHKPLEEMAWFCKEECS